MSFGYLTIVKVLNTDKHGNRLVRAECICGAVCTKRFSHLKLLGPSCGCQTKKLMRAAKVTHGCAGPQYRTETPEYKAWLSMKKRCNYIKAINYPDYGGRGIKVCAEWQSSFTSFLNDVGRKPSKEYSLDRINVNGNYEPGNVRWATAKEQARNRRSKVWEK